MHEDPPAPARTTDPRTRARTAPAPSAAPVVILSPTAPVPPPDSASAPQPGPSAGHSASTIERGSFCLARCTCGWSGPARRSRDLARTDAAKHLATP